MQLVYLPDAREIPLQFAKVTRLVFRSRAQELLKLHFDGPGDPVAVPLTTAGPVAVDVPGGCHGGYLERPTPADGAARPVVALWLAG